MIDQDPARIRHTAGEVKWFDPRKGYGFIVGPQGQDVFVHYSVIEGDGFRVLRDGASVEYDAERSDKGWKATRVIRVVIDAESENGEPHPASPTMDPAEVHVIQRPGYARNPRR